MCRALHYRLTGGTFEGRGLRKEARMALPNFPRSPAGQLAKLRAVSRATKGVVEHFMCKGGYPRKRVDYYHSALWAVMNLTVL
jgi:hypothetical protein